MRAFPVLVLAACSGNKATMDGMLDGGTGDTGDGGGTTPGACTALTEGLWGADASSTCFGMYMSATLTLETDGCTFTFSDWNMGMPVPDGGSVSGTDVTLDWAAVGDCTGTTDGTTMSGTCGDGCTYEFTYAG